jgi:hypothetical protein
MHSLGRRYYQRDYNKGGVENQIWETTQRNKNLRPIMGQAEWAGQDLVLEII